MALGARPFGRAPLGGTGTTQTVGSALRLQIGPIDVTPLLLWSTYRVRKELNSRDELEASLITEDAYVPALGESVILSYQGGSIFVGTVHERDWQFLSEADSVRRIIDLRCVDLNEVCDRRRVFEVFANESAGSIVRFIRNKYLTEELIQDGDIQEGALITRVVFQATTVADCFNTMAEHSGFSWNINVQRALNFFSRVTSPAPFTVTSANAVFRGLFGSRTRNQYRNVQYVDGGSGITDVRTEFFRGDGVNRTFTTQYKIAEIPTITKNFEPQTVAIRGLDETASQFYWSKNETEIGHDDAQPVLLTTDQLQVVYRGSFKLMGVIEDTGAILERKSVEQGSGRYEQLDSDGNLEGQELVHAKGFSLLKRFATLDDVIDFETDIPGLDIGQLVTVDVSELSLTGDYLITKVEIEFVLPERRRFRVTATTGDVKGRFQEFFARLLGASQPINIGDGQILNEVMATHDPTGVTDSIQADLIDAVVDDIGVAEVGTAEMGV